MEELARKQEHQYLEDNETPKVRWLKSVSEDISEEVTPEGADEFGERDEEIEREQEELEAAGHRLEAVNITVAAEAEEEDHSSAQKPETNKEDEDDLSYLDEEGIAMDALSIFMRDAENIPLLTAAEEIDLSQKIERGDLDAKEKMINSNLRLVVSQAKRYQGHGLSMEDLVQEGMLGLIRAVEKFDWRKGFKFSTYGSLWIRQALGNALQSHAQTNRKPVHVDQNNRKLQRLSGEFFAVTGREPNDEELAELSGLSPEEVQQTLAAFKPVISLETPIGEDGSAELQDILPSSVSVEDEAINNAAKGQLVDKLGRNVTPRAVEILKLRYGLDGETPHTRAEIAEILGIAVTTVANTEYSAIEKLRKNSQAFASMRD